MNAREQRALYDAFMLEWQHAIETQRIERLIFGPDEAWDDDGGNAAAAGGKWPEPAREVVG